MQLYSVVIFIGTSQLVAVKNVSAVSLLLFKPVSFFNFTT